MMIIHPLWSVCVFGAIFVIVGIGVAWEDLRRRWK
jgi:hypothetical protein